MTSVRERHPDDLDARVRRATTTNDDPDLVPSVGQEPRLLAEHHLHAAGHGWRAVMKEPDPEPHRSDRLAEAVGEQVLEMASEDGEREMSGAEFEIPSRPGRGQRWIVE